MRQIFIVIKNKSTDRMNNNMNTYGFKEQDYLKTWLEETRDWREHEHTYITEVEKRLTKEINDAEKNINTNVDAAETAIISKIEEHNNYVINTIQPKVESIETKVDNHTGLLTNIQSLINQILGRI